MTNAFQIKTSSSITKDLQRYAVARQASSQVVERQRANGREPMQINLTKRPGTDKLAREMLVVKGKV